jgi:hypothetical protein
MSLIVDGMSDQGSVAGEINESSDRTLRARRP